jgi:hypothetical protein
MKKEDITALLARCKKVDLAMVGIKYLQTVNRKTIFF